MSSFVVPAAVNQIRKALRNKDRVLVTGATGWFGRTLAALLDGVDVQVLFTSRTSQLLQIRDFQLGATEWNWEEVRKFAPTIVVDCAFVLRDYENDMSLEDYVSANALLGSRSIQILTLPTVRKFIYISSGAAIANEQILEFGLKDDPYAFLKRSMEFTLKGISEEVGTSLVLLRPWSVSGTLVPRPNRYAFSNIIQQAIAGSIAINASHEVWRRFVCIDDLLAVGLAIESENTFELNSGGELLEIGELAKRVIQTLNVEARITRAAEGPDKNDAYFSQDSSWDDSCNALKYVPLTLEEQIKNVERAL